MNQSSKQFDVIGFGRSYIDVIGTVPSDFLVRHDLPTSQSRYFDASGIATIQAELQNPKICSGGAIPNTVAGLAALGARAGFIGNVADDRLGCFFLDDLSKSGIVDLGTNPIPAPASSGTCLVLVTEDGERTFALHKGCVDQFNAEHVLSFDYSMTKYFVVGANLLTNASNGDLVAKIIEKAAASCRVVISLSQVHDWTGRETYAHETVASHAGLLIGNETEVDALMSLSGLSVSPETTLITTKGARGATARDATGEISVPATKHERFVNTLGAGDQFLAGYLMGQILQRGVEDSLNIGVRCADLIIQKNEARPMADETWAQLL